MSWFFYQEDWALQHKCTFDAVNKLIVVSNNVTDLDIKTDLYSSWKEWVLIRDNAKYPQAFRTTGGDPIGGGRYTGDVYFLVNGWKVVVDLTKVKISGVLYSDDYDTAYYDASLNPQYPAVVSALVNTVVVQVPATVTAQAIREEIDTNSTKLADMPNSIWTHPFVGKLLTVAKFLGLK